MDLSQEDIDFLKSKGIDPSQIVEEPDEKMSSGKAVTSTLKAHAGGIIGGGAGAIGAGASVPWIAGSLGLAPETGGASLLGLAVPIAGALGLGYAGQKAQDAILPEDVTANLQSEAAQAEKEHPVISTGTDVIASALASGGKFSPGALIRGGRAALAGDLSSPVVRNLALQTALNPAIDIGQSLATGNGLPSGRQLLGDVAGGALFSEPSFLGKLAHRPIDVQATVEPMTEPTADLRPSVTEQTLGPLKMAEPTSLPKEALPPEKNKDEVTQNKMDQTNVTPNPIDTKEATKAPAITEAGETAEDLQKQLEESGGIIQSPPDQYMKQEYSPEDLELYNRLKQQHLGLIEQGKGFEPEGMDVWKQFEDVRNKYGGMPPKMTEPSETVSSPEQTIDDNTPYQIIDTQTGQVVHEGVYKNRDAIRQAAERRNQAYGAYRYAVKPVFNKGGVSSPIGTETNIRNPIALAQHIQSGTATTGSVLSHYVDSSNHPYYALARHLLNITSTRDLSVPWKYNPQAERSSYQYGPTGHQVEISPASVGDSRVTMEEIVHSLTSKKLGMFRGYQGSELKNRMDRYLNEGDNESIKDLIRAYTGAADKFGLSGMLFKYVDHTGTPIKAAAGNPDLAYGIGERIQKGMGGITYAMGSLDEFLAHAFKNEQFQHLLDNMPSGVEGKSVWRQIVDSIKKLFGMDVKQGSMLEHVLGVGHEIISQERPSNVKGSGVSQAPPPVGEEEHYMGGIGRFTRAVIDRVRDVPHSGAEPLANATKMALNEKDRLIGQWKNKIIEAGSKLTPADKIQINKVKDLELSTKTLQRGLLTTDAQRNYYDVAKKLYSDNGDYRLASAEPVYRGGNPTPLKKDPTYWAGMANQKVEQVYRDNTDKAAIAQLDATFDKWNQTKLGMTPAASAKVINDYKTAIRGSRASSDVSHQDYFKASRMAMGQPLPPEFRETDPVKSDSRYFDRQAIDNSHYRFVEKNPQAMAALGATNDAWGKPITPNPEGSIANNPQVKSLLNQFKGETHGPGEDTERSVSSLVSSALISGPALEMHKLVSNEVKAASFADNPYQLVRAVGHAITNINQGYRHAVEGGLAKLTATSTLDMFNGSLTSAQRLNGVGKLIRDVSTLGGLTTKANLGFLQSYFEYLVPSKISRANAGDRTAQSFIKRLDPSYTVGKTYAGPEVQQLASLAGQYVHGTGDIRSMPSWMMNDSEVSGFFKLAHWSVAQTNNFMHDVWTPARNGNYIPLVTSVFGATIGGYIIKHLREELQGKKSGIPSLTEIAGSDRGLAGNAGPLAYNAIAAMQYSGFGGLLSQVAKYPFDFVYKNIPQGATFPLDQIATDVASTVGQVTSAIANDPNLNWVDLAKAVTGHVLQNDMQLSRIAINQGINHGLISGLPAEKKLLADKMGALRRFDMVEGLPYNDIDTASNPYMNIEQQKFKHEHDIGTAVQMIPGMVTNIMERYGSQPDVMMSKLKALKENSYNTMPSLESTPMQFFRYMSYIQRTQGSDAAESMMQDYMMHKITNQVKSSVVP